jgi:ribosomal protein S18 acetylase RimI-like enzyme
MDISIREAQLGDEPLVVGLIQELAEAGGDSSPITEEYVRTYLAFPDSHVLLAEVQGRAIGLLSYTIRPDLYHAASSGLIEELVVLRTDRGRGVASALLSEVLQRLAAAGCVEVSVATMPDNADAQRLYRSHGLVDEAIFLETHLRTGA